MVLEVSRRLRECGWRRLPHGVAPEKENGREGEPRRSPFWRGPDPHWARLQEAWRIGLAVRVRSSGGSRHALRPRDKRLDEGADRGLRVLVDELEPVVEEICRATESDDRLDENVERVKVRLWRSWSCARPLPAGPGARPHQAHRLVEEGRGGRRTRCPVDGVLDDTARPPVVLGGRDQQRIRSPNRLAQARSPLRESSRSRGRRGLRCRPESAPDRRSRPRCRRARARPPPERAHGCRSARAGCRRSRASGSWGHRRRVWRTMA